MKILSNRNALLSVTLCWYLEFERECTGPYNSYLEFERECTEPYNCSFRMARLMPLELLQAATLSSFRWMQAAVVTLWCV
jgi:hypothetical protein